MTRLLIPGLLFSGLLFSGLLGTALLAAQDAPHPGLRELPRVRVGRPQLFSSSDPSGSNVDHGQVLGLRDEGHRVLAQLQGPGRITRLWSANPRGTLIVMLDDAAWYRGPFADFFPNGTPTPGGGFLAELPIAFRRGLEVRIEGEGLDALYHQIAVERRDESVTGLVDADRSTLLELAADAEHEVRGVAIDLSGPGEVVALRAHFADGVPDLDAARGVLLTVTLDDDDMPSLAVPLGDLFGIAWNRHAIDTLPLGPDGDDLVLRLPMPFARHFALRCIALRDAAQAVEITCSWRNLDAIRDRLPLRASFTRALNRHGEAFAPPPIEGGPGHLVGFLAALAGDSGQGLGFLEGDLTLRADGEEPPSYRGTGTEDDFDGAWYFRGGAFRGTFHAVAELDELRGRVRAARFLIPDPWSFTRELRFALEHGGADDAPGSDYAVTLFWYGGRPAATLESAIATARANLREQCAPCPVEWDAHGETPERDLARLRGRTAAITVLDEDGASPNPPRVVDVLRDTDLAEMARGAARLRVTPWLPALRRFALAGPYAVSRAREGVHESFAPETDAAFDGWRAPRTAVAWDGQVDLYHEAEPRDGVVIYARCAISCAHDAAATLVLGSDDAIAVFLDGRRIFEHVVLRGSSRDSDRVPLPMTRGEHLLLFKIENYDGGFGFCARIEGAEVVERDPSAR